MYGAGQFFTDGKMSKPQPPADHDWLIDLTCVAVVLTILAACLILLSGCCPDVSQ